MELDDYIMDIFRKNKLRDKLYLFEDWKKGKKGTKEKMQKVIEDCGITPPFRGGWVTDFFAQGYTKEDFESLVEGSSVQIHPRCCDCDNAKPVSDGIILQMHYFNGDDNTKVMEKCGGERFICTGCFEKENKKGIRAFRFKDHQKGSEKNG